MEGFSRVSSETATTSPRRPGETFSLTRHHPKRHAARNTEEYLYNQLIPYIGNKRKLLDLIALGIERTGLSSGVFLDLFAGSGVVSRLAKVLGFAVMSNVISIINQPLRYNILLLK